MSRHIIESKCIACGSCIAECPIEAIKEGSVYSIDADACIDCGVCEATCPNEAIIEDDQVTVIPEKKSIRVNNYGEKHVGRSKKKVGKFVPISINIPQNQYEAEIQVVAKSPFFLYSKKDESLLKSIIKRINEQLYIELKCWSYAEIEDIDNFIENNLIASIERASCVIALFTKKSANDEVFNMLYKEAANRNKTVVPFISGFNGVDLIQFKSASKYNLRSNLFNIDNEDDFIKGLIYLHSLFGLTKKGDALGKRVVLASDRHCIVYRGEELLAEVGPEVFAQIRLNQGVHEIKFVSDTNDWNKYEVEINSNSGTPLTIINKMAILQYIEDTGQYPSINGKIDYCSDLSENQGYSLKSSSIDSIKFRCIVENFRILYKSMEKGIPSRPAFMGIELPKWLDGLVYLGAGVLCLYPLWNLIVLLFWLFIYILLAVCTLFIICFFWDPVSPAWHDFTDAFSWTLLWSALIVGGYWGLKLFLKGSYATMQEAKYQKKVLSVKMDNSKTASKLDDELKDILMKHNMASASVEG